MSYPRVARVGPFTFRIRWSTKAIKAEERIAGHGLHGITDRETQEIICRRDSTHDRAAVTLMHELLHACFLVADHPLREKAEERAVTKLAPVLVSLLRDNPHIIHFLTEEQP